MDTKFTPEQEQQIKKMIEDKVSILFKNEKYVFNRPVQFMDGGKIQAGNTNGLRIGTEATQKIALFGSTPVVKAGAVTAIGSAPGLYSGTYEQTIADSVNALITIVKNIGISS